MAAGTGSDSATRLADDADRLPRGSLAMVWWSLCSAMWYLFLGAALAVQYGTRNALLGAALGVVSHGILGFLFTRYAIRSGASCFVLSKVLFGAIGATLTSLLFFLTSTYYAVFESSIVVLAATRVFSGADGVAITLIVVLYSVLLVAGGVQRWLDKFNGALLPLYLGGLVAISALALREYGYSDAWLDIGPSTAPSPTAWVNCFMAFFGQQSLMMCALDIGRFGRRADERWHALVALGSPFYAIAFFVNTLVGIFLAGIGRFETVTENAVMDVCLAVLGGGVGLAFVWVTQTRINTANYVLAATNLQAVLSDRFGVQWHRLACAAVVGVIAASVMLAADIMQYILVSLSYMAVVLTSWVGVALAHITLPGTAEPGALARAAEDAPAFEAGPLFAWAASAVVGYWLLQQDGLAAALSVPASFVVAIAGYRLARAVRAPVPDAVG